MYAQLLPLALPAPPMPGGPSGMGGYGPPPMGGMGGGMPPGMGMPPMPAFGIPLMWNYSFTTAVVGIFGCLLRWVV